MTLRRARSDVREWKPGFYAILDPDVSRLSPRDALEALLSARPSVLQLRAKTASDRERLELARLCRVRCSAHRVPFVVNDRVDLALAADADGVHLGQDDLPIAEVRRVAPELAVGVSTHTPEQARAAAAAGADLVGLGPVFPTRTKTNADPTVGVDTLRQVCQEVGIPVVGIGGIDASRVSAVYGAGATFACAISAALAHDTSNAVRAAVMALGKATE